jgi:protein-S-isoprenylcysteine O-methyltransferase Ste14
MGTWRHVKAFLLEPFLGFFVVPALILLLVSEPNIGWSLEYPLDILPTVVGCALIGVGLFLLLWTSYLFAKVGKGTVAQWDPPNELVVVGIYRYMRNPLVWGVQITILGEAILFGALSLLIFCFILWGVNHISFVKAEEPELLRKFGDDYRQYMENVPRWLPRLRPWKGSLDEDDDVVQDETDE